LREDGVRIAASRDGNSQISKVSVNSCWNQHRVAAAIVFRSTWIIGALNDSKIISLILLPRLIARMVEAESLGWQVRNGIIVVSDSLVALSAELAENIVRKCLIASPG
jgi:hypothetical protein